MPSGVYARSPADRANRRRLALRHGHTSTSGGRVVRSRTYMSWQNMIARCRYPSVPSYPHYGGRGIAVCERWLKFGNFLADMGERPEGMQISRIDNDGDYEPGNCRWESQAANLAERNRRMAREKAALADAQARDERHHGEARRRIEAHRRR